MKSRSRSAPRGTAAASSQAIPIRRTSDPNVVTEMEGRTLVSKKVLGISSAVVMAMAASAAPTVAQDVDWSGFGNGNDALEIVFINDGHVAPYHVEWLNGLEDAAKAYDEAFGNVTAKWLSAEGSLEKMIEQAETTINENPDFMFVNAINTEAFVPLIAQAQEKGITWIAVHSPMAEADYSFTLGDIQNGTSTGLAMCALLPAGSTTAIMLGAPGNLSGDQRQEGLEAGLASCPETIEVVSVQPGDWTPTKAQEIAENWYNQYPELTSMAVVTDGYLYPSMAIAANQGRDEIKFFGYDGDKAIVEQMGKGQVMSDILLSGTREGWNFVNFATNIALGNAPEEQVYDFYSPPVLTEEDHAIALENGLPADIEVYTPAQALEVATSGFLEYGPDKVELPE